MNWRHWRRHRKHADPLHRIADAAETLVEFLIDHNHDPLGHTAIHVISVNPDGEEIPMPPIDHMPDFTLPSTAVRAVLAVVGAKKADGSYASSPTWSTSDESVLPLEPIADSVVTGPDPNWVDPGDGSTAPIIPIMDENGQQIPVFKTYANTPLTPEPGEKVSGTVTWKAAGMADVDIKVVYGDPALGHAAITAGEAAEV